MEYLKYADFFEKKNVLITGGTGSFGHHIVCSLLTFGTARIIVFSRDEKKQYDMENELKDKRLDFVIGDIRDYGSIYEAMKGADIVYHAAALKQVPNCEFHPFQAVMTNTIGAENIRRAAVETKVNTVIAISTDKAVKPVNVMGMTKAIQERILLNTNNTKRDVRFICVRYGNVVGSRGSVIPFFKEQIQREKPLTITHKEMTRFLITLDEAIELIFEATISAETGQLFVRKSPACRIVDLAKAMAKVITDQDSYPLEEVGVRPGEKIHEVLVSEEEMYRTAEVKDYYIINPPKAMRDRLPTSGLHEYNSNNTRLLNEKEIIDLLHATGWV